MLISCILMTSLIISTSGKKCASRCSNILDEVCAIAELKNRTSIKMKFLNICHMKKAACEEESFVELNQVENAVCWNSSDDKQDADARRKTDFGIVGAHQACNHTCPIACADIYDPACAQIWHKNKETYTHKTMLNHCHIDLFSCATGLSVTIDNLNSCLSVALRLQLPFIKSAAAMKSLGLLTDDNPNDGAKKIIRRTNVTAPAADDKISLKTHLKDVVRRIFDKYHYVNGSSSS